MGEVQRIVQQAAALEGPRRELAQRTREKLASKYIEATQELESPLIARAKQLEEGNTAQRQQVHQLEKQISSARKEGKEASKLLVDVNALQSAAERIDQRIRILEKLGDQLK